jgi:hypothetical protein
LISVKNIPAGKKTVVTCISENLDRENLIAQPNGEGFSQLRVR